MRKSEGLGRLSCLSLLPIKMQLEIIGLGASKSNEEHINIIVSTFKKSTVATLEDCLITIDNYT